MAVKDDAAAGRYLVISADGHDGPPFRPECYRSYLESRVLEEFDQAIASSTNAILFMGAAQGAAQYDRDPFRNWMTSLLVDRYGNDEAYAREAVARYWSKDAPVLDPQARVAALESQGVAAEFMMSSGPVLMGEISPALKASAHEAYTRWLVDYCGAIPGRLAATIPVFDYADLDAAIAHIRHGRKHGLFGGVLIPRGAGVNLPALTDPHWEPLWSVCEELNLPLIAHGGANVPAGAAASYGSDPVAARTLAILEDSFFCKRLFWHLIAAGVFDRHPNLKVGLIEQLVASIPGLFAEFDLMVQSHIGGTIQSQLKMLPSEYWRRHGFLGAPFIDARDARELRHEVGIGTLMWGGDYPHPEGSWPHMKTAMRHGLGGLPEAELRAILGGNAARCWDFDLQALAAIAARVGPTREELATPLPESEIPQYATAVCFAPQGMGRTPAAAV